MNDLGIALVWSAVQVTLLAVVAAALYGMASRRGPGTRAPVLAAALGASIALTLVALCPLPAWWTWKAAPTAPVRNVPAVAEVPSAASFEAAADVEVATKPVPQGGGLALPVDLLRRTWRQMEWMTIRHSQRERRWPLLVAVVFLAGATFGALRLLLGLWSVHQCRRHGRPIDAPALNALVEALRRQIGCPSPVELRACPDLGSPATTGWLRPTILLPADWPTWGEAELCAALAHELAHVRRADYLARLVARVSAALHFYHPLISWLAGRLQLQQELAADSLAARFAGGRPVYLAALARLALREEGRPLAWPARALLSSPGTLMRRIAMLQRKDCFSRAKTAPGGRAVLVALLAAVAVGVSTLRSPAQKAVGDAADKDVTKSEAPAKDVRVKVVETKNGSLLFGVGINSDSGLSGSISVKERNFDPMPYLSPDHAGVWISRPAAVFGRPEMKEVIKLMNSINEVKQAIAACGFEPDAGKFLSAIEQISGRMSLKTDKQAKGPQTGLFLDLAMVRMVHAFNWKKLLDAALPGAVAVQHAGKVYYRTQKGSLCKGSFKESAEIVGPFVHEVEICYHIIDSRTVLFDREPCLRLWLEGKKGVESSPAFVKDWRRVQGGLFAFALDNHDLRWLHDRRAPETHAAAAADALFRHTCYLVFGADYAESLKVQAVTRSGGEPDAEEAARAIRQLIAEAEKEREQEARKEPPKGVDAVADRVLKELLKQSHIEREGTAVLWHSAVKVSFADLVTVLMADKLGL